MPKILKPEVAKPIAEGIIAWIKKEHPELTDPQIRAALNTAASLTTPVVKKAKATDAIVDPFTEIKNN